MCVPAAVNFGCGGQPSMRAALTCNGNAAVMWNGLDECELATGCTNQSCPVAGRTPGYTGLVRSYNAFFCERARAHGVIVRAIGDTLACSVCSLPTVRAHHALVALVGTHWFQVVSRLAEKQALDSTGVVTGVCVMRLACGGAHDL